MATLSLQDKGRHFLAWLKSKRWIVSYLIALNIVLLGFGYLLLAQKHNPVFYDALKYIEPLVAYFSIIRISTEILIYFNWRSFVSWIRKIFRLSNKFTWALLQYRQVFRFVIYLDLAFFVLSRYREFIQ